MYREQDEFKKLGARVVIVGHSSVRYAKAFVEETGVDLPVYVDKDRVVYKALEFKRPLLGILNPKVMVRAAAGRKQGFSQPGVHGDAFQLGGVVLRMPDGSMPYRYTSLFAGDHPPVDELKAAVLTATT